MKKKGMLLFLMVGLLAMSFAIPAMAVPTERPDWALDSDDVEGWWIYTEDTISDWEYLYELEVVSIELTVWYQIWINNNTPQASAAEAWLNATAAMCICVIDFGDDLDEFTIDFVFIKFDVNLWAIIAPAFGAYGGTQRSVSGLDDAYTWQWVGAWAGVGYKGSLLILAFGYDSVDAPMNPFGLLAQVKTPSESAATENNILTLMGTQGSMLPGAIPGFSLLPLVISMVVLLSVIVLLRKDQLSLLKTN
ncbi:MAG TPA: hypothetical protein VMV49_04670 [Candidatus Deferrimicrobium sp.]|nr:hypothetical protein [Candidatus Deferrimicrobium sp.]